MSKQTGLEQLLEKHINEKVEEQTSRINNDDKLKRKYILDEVLKKYNECKTQHECFSKHNYSTMTAINEGGRLVMLSLIDELNSWVLGDDEKIIIEELKED